MNKETDVMSEFARFRSMPRRAFVLGVLATSLVLVLRVSAQSVWTHKGIRARYGHSQVFDAGTGKLILFGGQHTVGFANVNDLFWGTVGAGSTELVWSPILPTGKAPGARFGHTAVYDSSNARMLVFGGGFGLKTPAPCQNDLWLLQNANGTSGNPKWSQQVPAGTLPTPRFAHTSVYDPGTNTMIVFGGSDCGSTYLNDVWTLSNANGLGGTATWTQLSATGTAPSGRAGAAAVYDSTNNRMIVFGGDSGNSVDSDVWVLSNANGIGGTPSWTQLLPSGGAPVARTGHSAVYDAANNRMVIYAGQTTPTLPVAAGSTSGLLNDFWALINANGLGGGPSWIQLTPQTAAASRSFQTASYNSANNTMLIFGGKTNVTILPADDHITVVTEANGLQP